jgi:hypothetical protein
MTIRYLPHRASSKLKVFFPSAVEVSTETLDTTTDTDAETSISVRQFSDVHDARKELEATMRGAAKALRNSMDTWEASASDRCRFVHVVKLERAFGAHLLNRIAPVVDSFALVLHEPLDVGMAIATARITETREKQLSHVAKRHNAKGDVSNRTLLDAVGIPNTESAFVVMSLFGEMWTRELLQLHAMDAEQSIIVGAVQAASERALIRMSLCGEFVLKTTEREETAFFAVSDVAMLATEAGRDARMLCARLKLSGNTDDVEAAKRLRNVAKAMQAVSTKLLASGVKATLPCEPLQSLFAHPKHGEHAVQRVEQILAVLESLGVNTELSGTVRAAVAAAYPSNLLGGSGAPVDASELAIAEPPTSEARLVRDKLANRAAALRVDIATADAASATNVDTLTQQLSGVSIDAAEEATFYVPHGYGDAPPPLIVPGTSSPMFGSVPVYTSRVVEALDNMETALTGSEIGSSLAPSSVTTIAFEFWPCMNEESEGGALVPDRPTEGSRHGPYEHPKFISKHGSKIRVFGSKLPRTSDTPSPTQEVPGPATGTSSPLQLAQGFLFSDERERFSSEVATIAWNAERVLQAACLNAATRGKYVSVAIDVRVPYEPLNSGVADRSRALLNGSRDRARLFARSHSGQLLFLLNIAIQRLDVELEQEAAATAAAEAAAEAAAQAAAQADLDNLVGRPEVDGDGFVPGEPIGPFGGGGDAVAVDASAFAFGVANDATRSEQIAAVQSLAPMFHPRSSTLVQDFLKADILGRNELDVWANSAKEFEIAILERFPETAWKRRRSNSNAVDPVRLQKQRTIFRQVKEENKVILDRLGELREAIAESNFETTRVAQDGLETLVRSVEPGRIGRSRIALVASSVIGLAMASPSIGHTVGVSSLLNMKDENERRLALQLVRTTRKAFSADGPATALTLSEVCALFWAAAAATLESPSSPSPPPPLGVVALPWLPNSISVLRYDLVNLPTRPSVQLNNPLVGYPQSSNFIQSNSLFNPFQMDFKIQTNSSALALVLVRSSKLPEFVAALPRVQSPSAAWLAADSNYTISSPSDPYNPFSIQRFQVLTALITNAVIETQKLTTLEIGLVPEASASLVRSGQLAQLDVALLKGPVGVSVDELCLQFERDDIIAMCDILSKAGFQQAERDQQLVYLVPEGWTANGEARLELPGELSDFVNVHGVGITSMALNTLFQFPGAVEWTFNGDVATRTLEPPDTLSAFSRMRAFVLRNVATIALLSAVSASFALAMYLAPSFGVHPLNVMSTNDAITLSSDTDNGPAAIGALERLQAFFELPSVMIDTTTRVPRFVLNLGGIQTAYDAVVDVLPSRIRSEDTDSSTDPSTGQAVDVYVPSVVERVVGDVLYYFFVEPWLR